MKCPRSDFSHPALVSCVFRASLWLRNHCPVWAPSGVVVVSPLVGRLAWYLLLAPGHQKNFLLLRSGSECPQFSSQTRPDSLVARWPSRRFNFRPSRGLRKSICQATKGQTCFDEILPTAHSDLLELDKVSNVWLYFVLLLVSPHSCSMLFAGVHPSQHRPFSFPLTVVPRSARSHSGRPCCWIRRRKVAGLKILFLFRRRRATD